MEELSRSKAQKLADERYYQINKKKRQLANDLSATRRYIKKIDNLEKLDELENLINERRKELSKSSIK